jgi:hypothetical protein
MVKYYINGINLLEEIKRKKKGLYHNNGFIDHETNFYEEKLSFFILKNNNFI